jgi:hypothetical protein
MLHAMWLGEIAIRHRHLTSMYNPGSTIITMERNSTPRESRPGGFHLEPLAGSILSFQTFPSEIFPGLNVIPLLRHRLGRLGGLC